jgi:hypothetical protein
MRIKIICLEQWDYPNATNKQTITAKRATPSTNAAATIMLARKSPVASG